MANSKGWPAGITWNYDRDELIADGIVHSIGVSLGLAGAIVIVIFAANSVQPANIPAVTIYTISLLINALSLSRL